LEDAGFGKRLIPVPDDIAYKTFPLRIPPTLLQQAKDFAVSEGISLNFLINQAVTEKLSRMQAKSKASE
jgi:predicted HicB family RNase H-like nuclease